MPESGKRHACLVTPGHLSTNPRLVKEADALHEAGFQVSVVAARFLPWADRADREFDGRPWPVHRCDFGPLASKGRWLAQGASRRLQLALWRRFGGSGRLAEGAFHPAAAALRRLVGEVRADIYLAHNLAALPAAGRAAVRHGGRLGFDAEDFHLGEIRDEAKRERQLVRALEEAWLPKCAHLTAASPGIGEALVEAYGVPPPTVVLNVFPLAEAPPSRIASTMEPGPSLYWFSQTIGPGRGLECAVQALAQTRSKPHLHLRGLLVPGYDEKLLELARQLGVEDRVHFLPPVAPGEIVRDAAHFDVGLAAELTTFANRRIALTNKTFVYLLAGVPTVLSSTPAQAALAAGLGAAARLYEVDDPSALAVALDDLLLDREHLDQARAEAWRLARSRYCWDLEKERFLASVERALR